MIDLRTGTTTRIGQTRHFALLLVARNQHVYIVLIAEIMKVKVGANLIEVGRYDMLSLTILRKHSLIEYQVLNNSQKGYQKFDMEINTTLLYCNDNFAIPSY
jgi:hypothetical protein